MSGTILIETMLMFHIVDVLHEVAKAVKKINLLWFLQPNASFPLSEDIFNEANSETEELVHYKWLTALLLCICYLPQEYNK